MARDFWLNQRPVIRTGKINKQFTIPDFSVNCGEAKCCLRLFSDGTNQGYIDHILLTPTDLTAALTVEAWINLDSLPPFGGGPDYYATILQRSDANLLVFIYIDSLGLVNFEINKGGVLGALALSSIPVAIGEWTHVACTWDGADMKVYINSVLAGSSALIGPADGFTIGARNHFIGFGTRSGGGDSYKQFKGKIDEVRIWNIGRTLDQIIGSYLSPRNITGGDGVDDNLNHYYKIQEGDGATTKDSITGEDASILISVNQYDWITDDGFPYRYGSSFICNLFTVAVGSVCSLKFPINKPIDPNHGLFVRYTDDNGDWQRKMLYDSGESYDPVNIHESLFSGSYNGEKLSSTFYLEVWNVDGEPTADLTEDIIVKVSLTSNPTDMRDHTALVATTPTASNTLASTYPLANPVVINTVQTY